MLSQFLYVNKLETKVIGFNRRHFNPLNWNSTNTSTFHKLDAKMTMPTQSKWIWINVFIFTGMFVLIQFRLRDWWYVELGKANSASKIQSEILFKMPDNLIHITNKSINLAILLKKHKLKSVLIRYNFFHYLLSEKSWILTFLFLKSLLTAYFHHRKRSALIIID